ncbi:MAG: gamma carbonic anhydrase family protein [Chlorobiota bacterium]
MTELQFRWATVLPWEGKVPKIAPTVWLAEGVRIIGDVHIGEYSSVWFNTVVRGDVHSIWIGAETNIQDLCLLHVTHGRYPLRIGNRVTIGHRAIVHGAEVEDCCLIGMGACILDGARIGTYSIVAAGSVVRERQEVPPGVLVAGVPARVVRELTEEERYRIEESAKHYVEYAQRYRACFAGVAASHVQQP